MTNLQKAKAISEQIKNHLVSLGCTLVDFNDKLYYNEWQVVLPVTDAGKLTISIFDSEFDTTSTGKLVSNLLLFHGRFENPEKFDQDFCHYNVINPNSGKWNNYVDITKEKEVNDLLRYYSRMIPILDKSE